MNIYFSIPGEYLDKNAQRSLALRLLDYALQKEFGIARSDWRMIRKARGKPSFINSDKHFSYSHCRFGVACAVAKQPLGVDIQEVLKPKPATMRRVCHPNELAILESMEPPSLNAPRFIEMWALKEAYAKYTGEGLAEGFNTIDTTAFPPGLAHRHENLYIAYYTATAALKSAKPQWVQVLPP